MDGDSETVHRINRVEFPTKIWWGAVIFSGATYVFIPIEYIQNCIRVH